MALLLLHLLAAGALVFTPVKAPPEILPPSLGPLQLVSWLEGEDAHLAINKLHHKRIPMVEGYVAEYKGSVAERLAEATLWLAQSQDEKEAGELMEKMVQGLKQGSPSFGHYRSWAYGGQTIHEVLGSGQRHFIFRNGPWVVWAAVDPNLPKQVMDDLLAIGQPPEA